MNFIGCTESKTPSLRTGYIGLKSALAKDHLYGFTQEEIFDKKSRKQIREVRGYFFFYL